MTKCGERGKKKNNLNCSKCKNAILVESLGGIACGICQKTFHSDCVNIKCDDLVKYTESAWYCKNCNTKDILKKSVFIP